MEKKFSKIEIAVIKRTAQNVAQFVNKKEKFNAEIEKVKASKQEMIDKYMATIDDKIAAKVAKIEEEKAAIQPIIDSFQGPIKEMTGGFTTEDLVIRKVEGTGKIDEKTGKEIMQTRFVLKYPETVVPPTTEGAAGSDFDIDAEAECPSHEEMPEELVAQDAEAASENPFDNNEWQ